jgi:hypothetical protein
MPSQIIGVHTSLDRILAAVTQSGALGVMPHGSPIYPQTTREGPDMSQTCSERAPVSILNIIWPSCGASALSFLCQASSHRLVNAPTKYGTYGIFSSTAASSEDEYEETSPRPSPNAPIEASQGLANAAAA